MRARRQKSAVRLLRRDLPRLMAGAEIASYVREKLSFSVQRGATRFIANLSLCCDFFNPLSAALVARHRPPHTYGSPQYVLRYHRNAVT